MAATRSALFSAGALDGWQRRGRRCFVLGWFLSLAAGALNHTLLWGTLPVGGWIGRFAPHLRTGWVMFNRVEPGAVLWHYRPTGDLLNRSLSHLVRTPSFGYGDARAAINSLAVPNFPGGLCRRHRAADLIFERSTYRLGRGVAPVRIDKFLCMEGRMRRLAW